MAESLLRTEERQTTERLFEEELERKSSFYGQAERAISNGKLNALLRLHIRPINVIVYHGSSGRSHLREGFVLICIQHLS